MPLILDYSSLFLFLQCNPEQTPLFLLYHFYNHSLILLLLLLLEFLLLLRFLQKFLPLKIIFLDYPVLLQANHLIDNLLPPRFIKYFHFQILILKFYRFHKDQLSRLLYGKKSLFHLQKYRLLRFSKFTIKREIKKF